MTRVLSGRFQERFNAYRLLYVTAEIAENDSNKRDYGAGATLSVTGTVPFAYAL